MDIHRCRFVPFSPSAINAITFSHTSSSGSGRVPNTLRLAIGRANGEIEIWDPAEGRWVQESIIGGGKDRSIEGLVWTHDLETEDSEGKKIAGRLRLFSIGYSAVITEWDLTLGRPARHSDGNHSDVWCIAAQPRWYEFQDSQKQEDIGPKMDQYLVVGCVDGTLALHSTADGELTFIRTLQRPSSKKARVLSVAFQSRQRVVAGFSDSTIRIFDIRGHGRVVKNMSLGAGPKKGASDVFVWVVKCLGDGTIVSGDSTGEVKIWDSSTSSLVQRIQGHSCDILSIALSADGSTMVSGGMDKKTVVYKRTGAGKKKGRWAETSHQRLHSNDVKAMSTFEGHKLKVIASGGLDTTPVIIPLDRLGQEYSRSLSALPNLPPLQSSPQNRLVMSWWEREVSVWQIDVLDMSTIATEEDPLSRRLVAQVMLQGEETIRAASLSTNGSLLAVSTITEIKIFSLRWRRSSKALKAQRLDTPPSMVGHGAKMLAFSPDARWLAVVGLESSVHVHRLREENGSRFSTFRIVGSSKLLRLTQTYGSGRVSDGSLGDYAKSLSRLAWSSDSRILVACDLTGHFDSWMLQGHEDLLQQEGNLPNGIVDTSSDESSDESDYEGKGTPPVIFGQHWTRVPATLPKLPSAPLVMLFRPSQLLPDAAAPNGNIGVHPTRNNPHPQAHDPPDGEDRLLVMTTHHQLLEYHVMKGQLSDWSRRNPSELLPKEFRDIRERAMGGIWDISDGEETRRNRIWLFGSTWLWMFDLSRDLTFGEVGVGEKIAQGGLPSQNSVATTTINKKRKWEEPSEADREAERKASRKNTAGAGGKVPLAMRTIGIGAGMLTHEGAGQERWTSFEMEQNPPQRANGAAMIAEDVNRNSDDEEMPDADEVDTDEDEGIGSLVRLRREESGVEQLGENTFGTAAKANGDVVVSDLNGVQSILATEDTGTDTDAEATKPLSPPAYWRTYKYRPILGIVPLDNNNDEREVGIEVALVERTLWDVESSSKEAEV